jgi:hypothetical protein
MLRSRGPAALVLSIFLVVLAGVQANAAQARGDDVSSVCQESPQDAVAFMCADTAQAMYGYFITFIYPTPTYSAPPTFGSADIRDETNMITGSGLFGGIAVGLDLHYIGTETDYQPYWIDYNNDDTYHYIGAYTTASDLKNHTFMVIPHCSGCSTWDIFYDFNLVGTTASQPSADSFHMTTGWDLYGIYGPVGFNQTQNRIQFLNGNLEFQQFDPGVTSTLSPDGDCSAGADPNYCFHFNTNVSTVTTNSVTTVASWDVSKDIINPATTARSKPPLPTSGPSAAQLLTRAQQIVDQRLHVRH